MPVVPFRQSPRGSFVRCGIRGRSLSVAMTSFMFLSVAGVEAGAAPAVAASTAPSYAVTATIPVGAGPAPVAVNSESGRLYVGNQTDRSVSVVNTADNTVGATVSVGGSPLALA